MAVMALEKLIALGAKNIIVCGWCGSLSQKLKIGDILLPDATGAGAADVAVLYGSEAGATLESYPALEFMQKVFDSRVAIKLWTRLLVTYSGLMLRLTASRADSDVVATPGFELFDRKTLKGLLYDRHHQSEVEGDVRTVIDPHRGCTTIP